jgi:hypothetical protein
MMVLTGHYQMEQRHDSKINTGGEMNGRPNKKEKNRVNQ